jgi:hypothetical protein
MIKIENTEVFGWEAAIRGMRNPMNSWDNSDSYFDSEDYIREDNDHYSITVQNLQYYIGDNDLTLMRKLAAAGTDHSKYRRMITVYADITAPLYWWKEFDTYKVGTVSNSCSTMHKIHEKEFTLEDFSTEHIISAEQQSDEDRVTYVSPMFTFRHIIVQLNFYRERYIATKDKKYWWQMIQLLPSSYNQRRTVMLNYEVLANQYKARKSHKLDEWHGYCDWIEGLPYSEIITLA